MRVSKKLLRICLFSSFLACNPCFTQKSTSVDSGTLCLKGETPTGKKCGVGYIAVALADINNDKTPDLIKANMDGISVTLNRGDGTFHPMKIFQGGFFHVALDTGDINGDGLQDIVTVNHEGNALVYLGTGEDSLVSPKVLKAGSLPSDVLLADLNQDGFLDIVVADKQIHEGEVSTVNILFGLGNGNFQEFVSFKTGDTTTSLAIADVNGDSFLDIVAANFGAGTLSILFGNGSDSFRQQEITVSDFPFSLKASDLNEDGIADILVTKFSDRHESTVDILFGDQNERFQTSKIPVESPSTYSVSVDDLNRDGKKDFAIIYLKTSKQDGNFPYPSVLKVFLGNGTGEFDKGHVIDSFSELYYDLAIADLNRDQIPDFVMANVFSDKSNVVFQNKTH